MASQAGVYRYRSEIQNAMLQAVAISQGRVPVLARPAAVPVLRLTFDRLFASAGVVVRLVTDKARCTSSCCCRFAPPHCDCGKALAYRNKCPMGLVVLIGQRSESLLQLSVLVLQFSLGISPATWCITRRLHRAFFDVTIGYRAPNVRAASTGYLLVHRHEYLFLHPFGLS